MIVIHTVKSSFISHLYSDLKIKSCTEQFPLNVQYDTNNFNTNQTDQVKKKLQDIHIQYRLT